MTYEGNPFFKVEDLQPLELSINGVNSTSQVKFKSKSIQLTQILENGIWIEVPAKSCAMGHTLDLEIAGPTLEKPMVFTGVIEEMEGDSNTQVRVKFRQYSQEEWTQLLAYFSKKQIRINAIIKNSRK